jgi:trimeric autotransporter adhesin
MQINKNRKGLALGAAFSLIASLFVASAPAVANENAVVAFPSAGTESQTSILGTEAFDLSFRFGNSVISDLRSGANQSGFGVIISKPAGVTVSANVDYASTAGGLADRATSSNDVAGATAGTEFVVGFMSSGSPELEISLPLRTSTSAAVTITVTPYLNLNNNETRDNGETLGTPVTITFVPWSALGAVLTLGQPRANDIGATASFTVTPGNINWAQLDNDFKIVVSHSGTVVSDTESAAIDALDLVTTSGIAAAGSVDSSGQTDKGGASASFKVLTEPFTTSGVVQSLSAAITYGGEEFVFSPVYAVTAVAANAVTISPVAGANARLTESGKASARFNSEFTVRAFASSASVTTSLAVANAITVSAFANLELDADSGVVLNGVTYTTSAALRTAGFTLASGTTTFTVSTFGQEDTASADDTLTLLIKNGLLSQALEIHLVATELEVVYVPTTVAGLAGASKTFALEVEDQWGELPVRTDLRISATVDLGGSVSTPVTAAVVSGKASVTVTPVPATRTGSATVTFAVQRFDQNTQAWVSGGTSDSATWNVFSYAAGTDSIVSRTASISASISYTASGLSWSPNAIAVTVANSFSDVTVAAPGLMIQNVDLVSQTASDTLTVAANGKVASFKFTAAKAGTYTVTFTNGTATTTSQVVVHPAADSAGTSVTFDTTAIAAGSTRVITGTLLDANGNPVNTSGSATILVTYTVTGNAGIPIGTMPTETDADGKFTITVLTGANDSGTAVVSAAYYKSGAATAVAAVLTFNQSIVVGGAAAPATDQKLTVGSFKGFVAIYALNYTGQKLSAKVAGKWLVVESLTRFQRVVRNTGAAIPIVVDLYIDGKMVRTENIVTK